MSGPEQPQPQEQLIVTQGVASPEAWAALPDRLQALGCTVVRAAVSPEVEIARTARQHEFADLAQQEGYDPAFGIKGWKGLVKLSVEAHNRRHTAGNYGDLPPIHFVMHPPEDEEWKYYQQEYLFDVLDVDSLAAYVTYVESLLNNAPKTRAALIFAEALPRNTGPKTFGLWSKFAKQKLAQAAEQS